MHVVAHPASLPIGRRLATLLDATLVEAETKRFPDGEVHASIPDAPLGPGTVVVAALRPNSALLETLFLLDAVEGAGATDVRVAVPYVAYGRQDRRFEPGAPVSARPVAAAVGRAATLVCCLDVHAPAVLGMFGVPTRHASAIPDLAARLGERGVDLVLAPDKGALVRAKTAAEVLGCEWDALEKTRLSATEVRMAPKQLDVRGRTVAIVDDIIASGGTMATATGHLMEAGAEQVLVAATHGVFSEGALDRLEKAGVAEVIVTDSIPSRLPERSVVSCADALRRALEAPTR